MKIELKPSSMTELASILVTLNSNGFETNIDLKRPHSDSGSIYARRKWSEVIRLLSELEKAVTIKQLFEMSSYPLSYKDFKNKLKSLEEKGVISLERNIGKGGNYTLVRKVV